MMACPICRKLVCVDAPTCARRMHDRQTRGYSDDLWPAPLRTTWAIAIAMLAGCLLALGLWWPF